MHKTNYMFGYIITHSVANCSEIWKERYHIIIKFQNWIFLLWFIDCIESLCCGWCKLFFFIPSSRSGSGESLGKWLLVFHNNYFWAFMVSGFGSLFTFSNFRQVFRMASSCRKNYNSSLPSSPSVWSWQTFLAWPGMILLAETRLCLNLVYSFAVSPEDFPRFIGESMNMWNILSPRMFYRDNEQLWSLKDPEFKNNILKCKFS